MDNYDVSIQRIMYFLFLSSAWRPQQHRPIVLAGCISKSGTALKKMKKVAPGFFNCHPVFNCHCMGGVYQELGGAKHPHGGSKVLILMMSASENGHLAPPSL